MQFRALLQSGFGAGSVVGFRFGQGLGFRVGLKL